LTMTADPALETADRDLVQELLGSGDAKLVDATMAYLLDQMRGLDSFQEPILRREDLSERLAKKMVLWVLAALRHHLLDRFDVDLTALDDGIEAAAEEMSDRLSDEREQRRGDSAAELAAALAGAAQLTPGRLIQALRQGEVSLFIAMLAHLTGL